MKRAMLAALAVLSACAVGCTPIAPPILSSHHGAPGRVRRGDLEAGGAGNIFATGGVGLRYGATDHVAVEAGSDTRALTGDTRWVIGYAGVRTTVGNRAVNVDGSLSEGFAADAALGFGLGAYGVEGSPPELAAGGLYLQIGGAWHAGRAFALFVRSNFEGSRAAQLPTTFWWSHVGGPEVTIGDVSLYAATGVFGFAHDAGSGTTWYPAELGVSGRFDLSGAPRAPAARGNLELAAHHDSPANAP